MTARTPAQQLWIALALLWLAGTALRLTILAVPPVLPAIRDELRLSATEIGLLTGLPSMLFAIAAVPGALLIARLGVNSALVTGLALTAAGGALRGLLPSIVWLDAMTIVMGAGIAVMQVTMPTAVRTWTPSRIPFATAVYTNGLLIGEILPVALMLPLVVPLVGNWQRGFVVWSIPVLAIALMTAMLAPRALADPGAARRRWWPDWNSQLIWRLGIMLGTVNAMYFGTNAFLPGYLTAHGDGEWISASLSALNIGQLPGSFLLLAFASRLQLKAWPYVTAGLLCIAATGAIVWTSGIWVVAASALIGFAAAFVLILALALPPLLAAPSDVHRVTAAMFTISYSCAVIVPVLSGLCWDLSGIPGMAFAPIAVCGAILIALAPSILHVNPVRS
jgi:CP family cyanate transporter-like MFS transporter